MDRLGDKVDEALAAVEEVRKELKATSDLIRKTERDWRSEA